jgi:uncharacterized protein YqgC (DUF456 family)
LTVIGLILAVILFTVGVIGTILPALPGAPLIWLGMLVYGFFVKFNNLPWTFYLGQGLAVAMIFLIDYLAGIWGVKRYGGSGAAVWGSVIGGVLGVFLLGPLGLIFGPFIGAIVGELYRKSPVERAFQVGFGTILGFLGGTALKLGVETVMIVWFFIQIF